MTAHNRRLKTICCTVTTDLSYDQRMIRICDSLSAAGYEVCLIGRKKQSSIPLQKKPYRQKRLSTFFEKGKLFYLIYNVRLFFVLLFTKADLFCAIDLDTILPVLWVSKAKRKIRVYDAHELFCEMKEVVQRPPVYKAWKTIEKMAVPQFKYGYTVNKPIAREFAEMYGVHYEVIRNTPVLRPLTKSLIREKYIIYQGSVNEGRSFETLIPAMQWINMPLIICGDGNFMDKSKALISQYNLQQKIILRGLVEPEPLRLLTQQAFLGITLFENNGLSNYLSLANRFFDYIHAGTPQLCVDYPAYAEVNNLCRIAVVIKDLSAESIARTINEIIADKDLYSELQSNCLQLRKELNWETDKQVLINFYHNIFSEAE